MTDSVDNFDLQDKSLSLIDVCFEDDCLYNYPSPDPQFPHFSDNQTNHKTIHLLGVPSLEDSIEGDERINQPLESAEQEKTRTNEKYNLRKSLAWDSAFFTSAGVLEPEELSNMIGGTEKGGKNHILPGIEEDIRRSTESISSFVTDSSTLGTLEDDLFGDIRASIQKSSKACKAAISQGKESKAANESQHIKSSVKVDIVAQNKLKTKAAPNKPNVVSKGSWKQSGYTNGESSSFCKPPKIVGRVGPILTSANKRASLGANGVKMEKNSAKPSTAHLNNSKKLTVAGRGTKLPTTGGSRNTVPKSTLPTKSSLPSTGASKTELTTSSSVDSSGSLSSDSSGKRSLNSVKTKTDSKPANRSLTVSTVKSTSRTASRSMNQSMSSHISPYLKSVTKISSTTSPASSISEWSLESGSPTSTLNERTSSSRPSLDSTSIEDASDKCSVGHDTPVMVLPSESVKRASIGGDPLDRPVSIKPSGLRMPSPKIGFFDGVRSTVRSPGGSMQSHPAVHGNLPRCRVRNVSNNGGSNDAKLGKFQPARTALAVRGTKTCSQLPASSTRPKVCSTSVNKNSGQRILVEENAAKDCDTAANNPQIGYADGNDSLREDKISLHSESNGPERDGEFTGISGVGVGSIPVADNKILSEKVVENAACGQKEILGSLNANEKGKTCFEDQVDDLAQQVGAMDIHREIQQKRDLDCSLHQV